MKIKTISRDVQHHTRECVSTKTKVFRNADPKLHPMEKAREVSSRARTPACVAAPAACAHSRLLRGELGCRSVACDCEASVWGAYTPHDVSRAARDCPVCRCLARVLQYQRALVATKMERMFAKPFVGAMDGHSDSVNCCATSRQSLVRA